MINDVRWAWAWVFTGGSRGPFSRTVTIGGLGGRRIAAIASLARVGNLAGSDHRHQKAFFRQYRYQYSPDQILVAYEPNPDNAPSAITLDGALSITFEVEAFGPNTLAYGVASVFVY